MPAWCVEGNARIWIASDDGVLQELGALLVRGLGPEQGLDVRLARRHRREEELFLAAEALVEDALRDAGLPGDGTRRRRPARDAEDLPRDRQQLLIGDGPGTRHRLGLLFTQLHIHFT
jgi:hypothetical protein